MTLAYHCLHEGERPKECVHCGRCLAACPLFSATNLEELAPRAKFQLARALESGAGGLSAGQVTELASRCLSCGRCEKACPEGLCAPDLIARLRSASPGWQALVWKNWIGRAGLLWPAGGMLAKLVPQALEKALTRVLPAPLDERAGLALHALRAMRAKSPVRPWLRVRRFDPCGKGTKAVLFAGCTAEHARPEWTRTAERLLRGAEYDLAPAPDFGCCGCTLGHAGCKAEQRAAQERNLAAWRAAGRPLLATFCATCRCGLRSYASVDLGWEPFEAEAWMKAVQPLSSLIGETEFSVIEEAAPARVHYHRPCHGAGGGQDEDLLRRMAGQRIGRASRDVCCGLGGVLQVAAPELGARVAADAWNFFAALPGEQVLTGCSGCVLQLASTRPEGVDVGHWLDAVARN